MVEVDDLAPDFELKDQNQKMVRLKDFEGKKVLIAFYPFAFSPVCMEEMGCFETDMLDFQDRDITIIGISVDSHWTNKAFAEKLEITIPLLSDFNKEVSRKYGVLRPEGFPDRAYFLIDKSGRITYKKIMDTPGERLENEDILKAITYFIT